MAFRTVVVLVLYVVGALRKLQDGANQAADANTLPADEACQVLGAGFGLQHGCRYPQAMMLVPECANAAFDQACYEVVHSERVTAYSRDLRSSSDFSSMSHVVTEAEGGSVGKSVSAGFSVMKNSKVSEQSLAFFLGASGRSQTKILRRPVAMKLTTAAKDLLRSNASEFLRLYGLKYVHSITYGGSFLGSLALNSWNSRDDTAVQAFLSFSVSKGLFSVSGSADFEMQLSKSTSSVQVHSEAKWRGGSGISLNPRQNPLDLYDAYQQWTDSWRAHPDPLLVTARRWIDSADVQEIVNNMTKEDRDLFHTADYSPLILTEISEESAKLSLIDASITQALNYPVTQGDTAVETCLVDLGRSVTGKSMQIGLLDDADLIGIQNQYLQENYSWFESAAFLESYEACICPPMTNRQDLLFINDRLRSECSQLSQLTSLNGDHWLSMQSDGNLVFYRSGIPHWSSNTQGEGTAPYRLILEGNGDLVLRDGRGTGLWYSHTRNGTQLKVGTNGVAVLRDHTAGRVWSTNTN